MILITILLNELLNVNQTSAIVTAEENMKGNVYLVVHDLTFYFNHNDTVISERVILSWEGK